MAADALAYWAALLAAIVLVSVLGWASQANNANRGAEAPLPPAPAKAKAKSKGNPERKKREQKRRRGLAAQEREVLAAAAEREKVVQEEAKRTTKAESKAQRKKKGGAAAAADSKPATAARGQRKQAQKKEASAPDTASSGPALNSTGSPPASAGAEAREPRGKRGKTAASDSASPNPNKAEAGPAVVEQSVKAAADTGPKRKPDSAAKKDGDERPSRTRRKAAPRPSASFQVFCEEQEDSIRSSSPEATDEEVQVLLQERWAAMDSPTRKPYNDVAARRGRKTDPSVKPKNAANPKKPDSPTSPGDIPASQPSSASNNTQAALALGKKTAKTASKPAAAPQPAPPTEKKAKKKPAQEDSWSEVDLTGLISELRGEIRELRTAGEQRDTEIEKLQTANNELKNYNTGLLAQRESARADAKARVQALEAELRDARSSSSASGAGISGSDASGWSAAKPVVAQPSDKEVVSEKDAAPAAVVDEKKPTTGDADLLLGMQGGDKRTSRGRESDSSKSQKSKKGGSADKARSARIDAKKREGELAATVEKQVAELDSLRNEKLDAEKLAGEATATVDKQTVELDSLRTKLAAAQEASGLTATVEKQAAELDSLQNEKLAAEKRAGEAAATVGKQTAELESLRTKLAATQEDSGLADTVDKQTAELESLRNEKLDSEKRAGEAAATAEKQTAELASLRAELATAQQDAGSKAELESVRSKLVESEALLKAKDAEVAQLTEAAKLAEQATPDISQADMDRAKEVAEQASKTVDAVKIEFAKTRDAATAEIKELSAKLADAESSARRAEERAEQTEAELKKEKAETDELRRQLDEAASAREKSDDTNTKVTNGPSSVDVEQLREALVSAEQARTDLRAAEDSIVQHKKIEAELRDRVAKLEQSPKQQTGPGRKQGKAQQQQQQQKGAAAAKTDKALAAAVKEGGKKGQDLCGMSDMGGMSFFAVAMEDCMGRRDYLEAAMKAANAEIDPSGDDRKGGAGKLGKMLLSASNDALAVLGHVPDACPKDLSLKEWAECIAASVEGNIVEITEDTCFIEAKADQAAERFPLKMREGAINASFGLLRQKGLVVDDDSDDDFGEMAEAAGIEW
jgi:HMG (high mobility group) box